jgi:3-hydroxyacyl-[acyl-carrier-protein] dehydratase
MDGAMPVEGTAIGTIDIGRVMELIPHRYPFLLIDRVDDVVLGESAVGVKNVSVNENFFQGHFPNHPVMPGVLIIESMAQTAAVLVVETLGPAMFGKLVYFMSIERAKFRRPVVPGDQLRIHAARSCRRRSGRRGDCHRNDHRPLTSPSAQLPSRPKTATLQTVTGRSA